MISIEDARKLLAHIKWDTQVEKDLAEHLAMLGVFAIPNFRVPGSPQIGFDFYLPQTPRAVIEITSNALLANHLPKIIERIPEIHSSLGEKARIYLVVYGADLDSNLIELARSAGIRVIQETRVEVIAQRIQEDFTSGGKHQLSTLQYSPFIPGPDELSQEFLSMLFTYEGRLTPEDYKIFSHELDRMRAEWKHGHFTSAALRIGRAMEYVVYAICRSWDVRVNEPRLTALKQIDDGFKNFEAALIDYSAGDADINKTRITLLDKAGSINQMMLKIVANIEQSSSINNKTTPPPRNTQAMLNDLRDRYREIDPVPETLEKVRKPVAELNKRRNASAHASVDGNIREVTEDELKGMVKLLTEVLNELAKCWDAIETYKEAEGL